MELGRDIKKRFHGSRGGESGFTMIEMMIAMVILAFGLMGVTAMMLSSIRGNAFGSKMTTATTLVQDKIEELRSMDYNLLYNNCNLPGFPVVCPNAPGTMALDDAGLILVPANDSGNTGDELWEAPLTGGGDGFWTYMYQDPAPPLPYNITLVWGVRRNYPHPRMIWIAARAEWREDGQLRKVEMDSIIGNF
ncbi:MAG TPA: prepilin-type N-terminal cleavage/methylation domain-containing protein [Nitrospiria bacterium]